MKTAHTPGPWHFGAASREIHAHGVNIARVYPGMFCSHTAKPEEAEANAALIASAPTLLAALRGLVDCAGLTWLPGYKDELDAAMREARAAIAAAEPDEAAALKT